MTTKRTTGRYGERVALPTKQMSAMSLEDAAAASRDSSRDTEIDDSHALKFAKTVMTTTAAAGLAPPRPTYTTGHEPPEIQLTKHELPGGWIDPRLVLVRDPDSARAAEFRVLRHHLLEIGRPQCVVVSSASAGDGKTTVALNLALALAECNRAKVLLLETNLRAPALARVLGATPSWCFAEQLMAHRQQPMLPWSLIDMPSLWLHVGAVNAEREQGQLLDAPAFAIAVERLRLAGYDHIVIDGPSAIGSADVNMMAEASDTVMLAVRAGRTTARDIRHAIEQIGARKVAGAVLVE